MSIVLLGSTSGSCTLQEQAVAGTTTLTLPTITGPVGVLISGTAVATTSGTSIDFTSIPAGVRRITVMFSGVSLSGTSNYLIQVGAGSVATTGYSSGAVSASVSSATTTNGSGAVTNGISTNGYTSTAASLASGHVLLTNITGNTWVASGILYADNAARIAIYAGNVALGGTLDRVRITTVNGTDTFDAGSINILYE